MAKHRKGNKNANNTTENNNQQPGPLTNKKLKLLPQQPSETSNKSSTPNTSTDKITNTNERTTFLNWDEDNMDYESSLPPSQRTKYSHGKNLSPTAPPFQPQPTSPVQLGNVQPQPTPIINTDTTIITKTPKFVASIPIKAFRGQHVQLVLAQVQTMMINHAGFLKATNNFRKHCIDVHFDSRSALEAMINSPDSKIDNYQFKAIPNSQDRHTEKGRTVRVTDIPLYVKSTTIYEYFKKMGNITRFSMITRGRWQVAYVIYDDAKVLQPLYDACWAVHIMDFQVRLYPTDLTDEQFNLRKQHCLKLVGLPNGCSHKTINEIHKQSGAASCTIPRDDKYKPRRYAYFHFKSQQDLEKAKTLNFKFYDSPLYWINPEDSFCFRCGSPSHDIKSCDQTKTFQPKVTSPFKALYDRFRPAQYRPENKKNKQNKVLKPSHKLTPPSTSNKKTNNRKQPSYADVVNNVETTPSSPTKPTSATGTASIHQQIDNIFKLLVSMQASINKLLQFESVAYNRFEELNDTLELVQGHIHLLAIGENPFETDDMSDEDTNDNPIQIEGSSNRITRSKAAQQPVIR